MRHGCRRFLLAGTDDDDRWCGEDVCRPKTNILEFILILIFWNETCDIIFTLCLVFTLHFQASQSLSISLHLLQLSDEGKNSLSKMSVCEFARSYTTTRMEERWIWTRANSSTIRPQLKYWLWRILIQKYYVCFSLTLAFASNTTTRRIFFLVSTNEHSHFIFVLSWEFFFTNRWNEISHWATRTLFFFIWFSWYFFEILFFFTVIDYTSNMLEIISWNHSDQMPAKKKREPQIDQLIN